MGTCWGPCLHARPGPPSPTPCVAKPGKERGPPGLPVQPLKPGHPPRRRSSLRARSASSRSPPADSRPGPSSPRASMGPVAWRRGSPAPNFPAARGGHGFRGPRPVSELFPALLGAAPAGRPGARSLRPRGGRSGGRRGRGAGRGRGSLRRAAGVRWLRASLLGDPGCPDATRVAGPRRAGTVRGGARPGLPVGAHPGPAASCPALRAAG